MDEAASDPAIAVHEGVDRLELPEPMRPEWLQALNDYNPVSHVIEAIRSLMIVGFVWEPIWQAIVSIVVLAVILHSLTLWAFRRLTS